MMDRLMFWKKKSPLFAEFTAMAEKLVKGSQLLGTLFQSEAADRAGLADRLKENEHAADLIAHAIFQRLHQTFIHPFEHEDVILFVKALDDVVDATYHIGEFTAHIFAIKTIRSEACVFSHLLQESCLRVEKITHLLSDTSRYQKQLEQEWITIHKLENQADLLLRHAMRQLYLELEQQTLPVSLYCAWQELFRMLEGATDLVEECAHITEQLTMKYS